MNVLAVIPARKNSTRLPHKNIKKLGDKPLIMWSVEIAKLCKLINRVIVTTDSEEIIKMTEKYVDVIRRPKELATPKSTDIEYMLHLLNYYKDEELALPDYIVLLRPTTPLRNPKVIDEAIEYFSNQDDVTSLRSVSELKESPYKSFVINKKGYLEGLFPEEKGEYHNFPTQYFPKAYTGNGYVDILKPRVILKTNTLYGDKILPYQIEGIVVDIDNEADFSYAEYLIL